MADAEGQGDRQEPQHHEEHDLGGVDDAEAEAFAEDMAEIDDEALELEQVKAERDEYKDRFMRALADAENSRKRSDRASREAENYGGSKLSRDILPDYDNMKRAIEAAAEEAETAPAEQTAEALPDTAEATEAKSEEATEDKK